MAIPINVNGMRAQVDILGNITVGGLAGGGGGTYDTYAEPTPTISGKMLTVTNVIKQYDLEILPDDEIKRKMIYELAEEMAKSNMIEFTKQNDPTTDTITYRARCFMTPNDQVQILRKNGYK
jgi:hypothetical protein